MNAPLEAGADHLDVAASARRRRHRVQVEQAAHEHGLGARSRGQDRPGAVGSREDERLAARLGELARRVTQIEPGDRDGVPLPGQHRVAEAVPELHRLLDLRAAEHPAIAGRERLGDRRGRPEDVDDDRRGRALGRSGREGDVHAHRLVTLHGVATMARMATPEQTQTRTCYRHPGRETAVSCSNCGRPICPDCMVYAAVGIKCPECAGQPTGAASRDPASRPGRRCRGRRARHEDAHRDERRRLPDLVAQGRARPASRRGPSSTAGRSTAPR